MNTELISLFPRSCIGFRELEDGRKIELIEALASVVENVPGMYDLVMAFSSPEKCRDFLNNSCRDRKCGIVNGTDTYRHNIWYLIYNGSEKIRPSNFPGITAFTNLKPFTIRKIIEKKSRIKL